MFDPLSMVVSIFSTSRIVALGECSFIFNKKVCWPMENIKQTKVCERDSPSSLHTIKTNKQQAKGAAFYKRKARADAHWRVFFGCAAGICISLIIVFVGSSKRNGSTIPCKVQTRHQSWSLHILLGSFINFLKFQCCFSK